jgi:hypothetical protein
MAQRYPRADGDDNKIRGSALDLFRERSVFVSGLSFRCCSTVIDSTLNQDRICIQAYSLRLYATINRVIGRRSCLPPSPSAAAAASWSAPIPGVGGVQNHHMQNTIRYHWGFAGLTKIANILKFIRCRAAFC